MFILVVLLLHSIGAEASEDRTNRTLSIFNVIKFPNYVCASTSNLNGTCYTASECSSLGGSASGSCASSFGVCCVFSLSCGGRTSANTSYATIGTFSTSSDTDPCTYTFCKCSSDVCKLRKVRTADWSISNNWSLFRIDYESMVLADPGTISTTVADIPESGANTGDCITDSLSSMYVTKGSIGQQSRNPS